MSKESEALVVAVKAAQLVMSKTKSITVDGYWGSFTQGVYGELSADQRFSVDGVLRDVGNTTASELFARTRASKGSGDKLGFAEKQIARSIRGGSALEQTVIQRARAAGITGSSLVNLLANIQVESGFVSKRENYRYSPQGARDNLKNMRNLTDAQIQLLVSQGAEAFFNVAYKGKAGNTQPDDGGRFYGRGLIQLTGRSNYTAFSKAYPQYDALNNPDVIVQNNQAAVDSAIWFWKTNVMASGRDTDVRKSAAATNGGSNGLSQRIASAAAYSKQLA